MIDVLDPTVVVATIETELAEGVEPVSVFWCQTSGSRTSYERRLLESRGDLPIVPVVLRSPLFVNPNAIMDDVSTVIEQCRSQIETVGRHGRVALVILSHAPLGVPQISSPTVLPAWFPVHAGNLIHTHIEDLTVTVDGPLNKLADASIAEYIYHLDGMIIRRLRAMDAADHSAGTRFLEHIVTTPSTRERFQAVLAGADRVRKSVQNPSQFRPMKTQASIVGSIWSAAASASTQELDRRATLLAEALGVPKDVPPYYESVFSLFARPAVGSREPRTRFARSLVDTILSACQAVTVAHHSDYYPKYPLMLLQAVSDDLRRSLTGFEAAISRFPEVTELTKSTLAQ